MRIRIFVLTGVLVVVIGVLWAVASREIPPDAILLTSPNGMQQVPVRIEVMLTQEERAKGLMFRDTLAEGHGMMFGFEKPDILTFWMKNVSFPLDIIFFNPDGVIVDTQRMEPCATPDCAIYSSAALAQFALEVPAGFVEEHEISNGWRLTR